MVRPPPASPAGKTRKNLSADALDALVRQSFQKIPDPHPGDSSLTLTDALMSAFALFTLKDPSLLAFDERRNDANMKALFGIGRIPSDTRMREMLDPLDPEYLRPVFGDVFRQVQRGKALEQFQFHGQYYLLSLDGTGYFSSPTIHAKNDCERNAARRLLAKIRRQHPRLRLIVVEDGLASNGPHVRDLRDGHMRFLLGVKPGDHPFLFEEVAMARRQGRSPELTRKEKNVTAKVSWVWDVPLNEANEDLPVNFLEYQEHDAQGNCLQHFTWITDLHVTRLNAWELARGGRARWHIENETFNTLKNQGYHFEHNYGHGKEHLSVVFAMLMMLAFLVDQTQQLCCPLFRAVLTKVGSKRALWEKLRSHFYHFTFRSMRHLYEVMLHDLAKEVPLPPFDTS